MAKPKLALIPSAQGSKFYSVLPSSGVGDFDFTRSGSATRINSQGLIESVANGVSRLNYPMIDGVVKGCPHHILEPQRLQLLPYSEDFSNSGWQKYRSSILSNNAISPDGTLNADKLVDNSVSSTHATEERRYSLSSGSEYTYSFFAKANEIKQVGLLGSNPNQGSKFDLENGVVYGDLISAPNSSKIENFGNGWYRCSITTTLTGTDSKFGIYLTKNGSTNYSGNGTDGIYIYGAQLEQGSYPTSYIPTNGSTVTRSAETATGSGDASTFNSEQGVLMAEISAFSDDSTNRQMTLSDGNDDNRLVLKYDNQSNIIQSFNRIGGVESAFLSASITDITLFSKCLVKYKVNDYQLWINGFKLDTDISAAVWSSSTLNDLKINAGGGADFYGNIKQLQYFDTADIDLEQLTSWVSFQDMAEGQLYTIE
jgi:hypothetical protein